MCSLSEVSGGIGVRKEGSKGCRNILECVGLKRWRRSSQAERQEGDACRVRNERWDYLSCAQRE